MADTGRRIDRVYFLIHPLCWAAGLCEGRLAGHVLREDEYYGNLELERNVRRKQDALIAGMGENEALILYPVGQGPEMLTLERFAGERLGDRCLVLRREPPKRTDYEGYLPDPILADLSREVMRAYVEHHYAWQASAIKVLYTNRAMAYDIEQESARRGWRIDPRTVEAEAFGEGFEACAMTWKGMVGAYLGWQRPIENRYELSVSGTPFLIHADFRGRLALAGDLRLFLWMSRHGRPIGFYARAGFRLADHQRFVRLPAKGPRLEVVSSTVETRWPVAGAGSMSVRQEADWLRVAVYEGGRKFPSDDALYILGEAGASFDEFAALLRNAEVIEG